MKEVKKVAFLTAGGLAPCLSSSIGFLIDEYTKRAPQIEMIGYINGYMGLLKGESIPVTDEVRKTLEPTGVTIKRFSLVEDLICRGNGGY